MASPWTVQYYQKVLATNPIAYWPLDEKAGTVAYDLVSRRVAGAQNGAHAAVTLYQTGIGDGRRSTSYNGATSYTNAYSAAISAAFSGVAGTVVLWVKVSAVGVWTDGAVRRICLLYSDANNFVFIEKRNVNNTLRWEYVAGGTIEAPVLAGLATVDWMHLGLTWNKNAGVDGEVRAYYNGAQTGATETGLGVWGGVGLAAANTTIGAGSTAPASVWSGTLAHCAIWTRALSADEIAQLAVVV